MSEEQKLGLVSDNMTRRRIFIFTMTKWDEQPRLRHQVAKLLCDANEEVHFFQGSRFPWRSRSKDDDMYIEDNLYIHRALHVFHPHLRVSSLIRSVNNVVERFSILKIINGHPRTNDIVINFNYDFYFLREIFGQSKIITIINDDFVAQAKFLKGRHVRTSLRKTCAISDEVLTVSYPLIEQLREWCVPKLFLPWADVPYCTPKSGELMRNAILLWAHIDTRIDFSLLRKIAEALPETEFHVYGNRFRKIQPEIDKTSLISNISFREAASLSNIDMDRYFAAIIPYKSHVKDIEAVTLSNKTFQLLARGLPIVTSGMPYFYNHPAIHKATSINSFVAALRYCRLQFWNLQPSIEIFVQENQAINRYKQLRDSFV